MTETKGLRAEAGDAGGTGRVCVVLLPGLDGTGVLFRPFLQACPEHVTPVVIDFPRDERLDYAELEQHVVDRLPTADRTVIVGESFSGPLALRVAARRPAGLIGVVLCASFVRPPGACWLACLPWRLLLRLRAPDVLLRRLLTGREKAAELVPLVREALGRVQPSVLAHRMKLLRHLDADRELTECPAPVLYLRGSEDRLVKEKSLTEIRDICPDAVVHTVRAPHLVLQCAPQEAWNAVTSFLAAPPSPGSGPARVATASPYGSLIHYSPPADTVPELSMAERSGPLTARRSEVVDNSAAQMFRSVGKLPDPLNRRVVCHAAMWLRSPSSFPAKDNFRFVVHLPFDRLRAVRGLERRISELGFRIGELGFSGLSRWGVGLVLVLESCGRKAHAWQCVGVGRGRSDVVLEGGKSS